MFFFFFNDTATTEIYTLSLHDALPIWRVDRVGDVVPVVAIRQLDGERLEQRIGEVLAEYWNVQLAEHRPRSEEHTSELQSRQYLVCRLLLEKKRNIKQLSIMISTLSMQ